MKSYKFILGSQYFLYFGVLGLFLPYFNLYCYHLGFSGFEIGVLASVRTLTTALFPMIWGALADRFLIRRPIYIFCNFVSTAIWALFLLTTDFWAMLAITAFYGLFYAPIIAFLESFSMDLLAKKKTRYGQLRAWGSFSFVLIVIISGRLIDTLSTEVILIMILAGSLIHSLLSINVPSVKQVRQSTFSASVKTMLNRRVIIFLTGAFLMLVSHGTYYGFFSIHLENLGFSGSFIGIAWALASVAEIFVMINSERILKRFSYENILIFSFIVAVIRWFILYFATSSFLILFSQLLHAVTYGAFHVASILYMDKLTPTEAKTLGQAVNNAVTYGFGIMAGFLFNGYYFEIVGAPVLFIISGILAFCGGILLFMNKIKS
ncbi:MAG: MFS transporter [Desulfobacteraceae bacterium]|nr:MFS transporter [Desulfobacteraceae bacterium]MBC2757632.1 MFS transporter [Desulfobacteraceae bacterium]